MSETQAIAEMAEILSAELFPIFKWKTSGPVNQNWDCINSDKHFGKKTHPSDVVFYYDDPYSKARIYINIDLKSYAKGSISVGSIQTSIRSLYLATECANCSGDWQELYSHSGYHMRVNSLLFIYNHDGEYDADFDRLLSKCNIDLEDVLPARSKVAVFGPKQISELNTISNDIQLFLARKNISNYEFFYPELSTKANLLSIWSAPATLEMLTSGSIVFRYQNNDGENGIAIYYRRLGETREEFMYLIDYLFHYQVIRDSTHIDIRLSNPSKRAIANFSKAKDYFITVCDDEERSSLSEILDKIEIKSITTVVSVFSEIEIGMRNA